MRAPRPPRACPLGVCLKPQRTERRWVAAWSCGVMRMREAIRRELEAVEQAKGVRVLLSVESGSRSWGMASEDSDYDVRFVYVRPLRDYLRLDKGRDTIEWRLDKVFDVTGWDVVKFLRLMRGSNPSVFEWLSASIVYAESPDFALVREVSGGCFSPKASAFHYLGMEREHDRAYLHGPTVGAKKYLYMVRALLAARWCLEERSPAPMLLRDLMSAKLPAQMAPVVEDLLAVKAAGKEHQQLAHIPELEAWIAAEDEALYAMAQAAAAPAKVPWDVLNEVFWELVQ